MSLGRGGAEAHSYLLSARPNRLPLLCCSFSYPNSRLHLSQPTITNFAAPQLALLSMHTHASKVQGFVEETTSSLPQLIHRLGLSIKALSNRCPPPLPSQTGILHIVDSPMLLLLLLL
uniref:Uncharacterized protein n=1 Tax=Mesocestoides corti TaxID=53468 RepID=A0A5K3G2B5_MESCO